jgi:hypothetical protein
MRTRDFIIQLLTACAALLLANLLVGRGARNSVPQQELRHARLSSPTDCIFAGSSVVVHGMDPAAFEAALPPSLQGKTPLNIGMRSSTVVEHDFLLFEALKRNPRPRWVIYGFFGEEITTPISWKWSDLISNRSMVFHADPVVLPSVLPDSPALRLLVRAVRFCPLLTERGQLWAKVERIRRVLEEVGMPPVALGAGGRLADIRQLVQDGDIDSRLKAAIGRGQVLSPPFKAFLDLALAHRARVFVVAMPQSKSSRAFYARVPYLENLRNVLDTEDVTLISAVDWMNDSDFLDDIHLSGEGAARFSRRLATAVAQLDDSAKQRASSSSTRSSQSEK